MIIVLTFGVGAIQPVTSKTQSMTHSDFGAWVPLLLFYLIHLSLIIRRFCFVLTKTNGKCRRPCFARNCGASSYCPTANILRNDPGASEWLYRLRSERWSSTLLRSRIPSVQPPMFSSHFLVWIRFWIHTIEMDNV